MKTSIPNYGAFDTETVNGKAVLLSYATEQNKNGIIELESLSQALELLTSLDTRILFAFNLDYDVRALLAFLPIDARREVFLRRMFVFDSRYELDYIPRKCLTVAVRSTTSKKRTIFRFYDCWQYYEASLDAVGEKLTGTGKAPISKRTIASLGRLNRNGKTWAKVREYCKRDAELTLLAAVKLRESFTAAGMGVKTWHSAGTIAKRFLRSVHRPCSRLPIPFRRVCSAAYFGGRVESVKRGTFQRAFVYDIRSAYPAALAVMPDVCGTKLLQTVKPLPNLPHYVTRVRVWTREDSSIQPFAVRTRVGNVYPVIRGKVVSVHGVELEAALDCGLIEKAEYIETLHLVGGGACHLSEVISRLYERKRLNGADRLAVKKVLNSLYGVHAQTVREYGEDAPIDFTLPSLLRNEYLNRIAEALEIDTHDYRCKCGRCKLLTLARRVNPSMRSNAAVSIAGKMVKVKERHGAYFNSFYAGFITAHCRAALLRAASLKPESVIFLATDSVASCEPLSLKCGDGLGEWEYKPVKNLLCVANGVYQYETDSGKVTKFRGFSTALDLRTLLERMGKRSKLRVNLKRPTSLYESLGNRAAILNAFSPVVRTLALEDRRREWAVVSGAALLSGNLTSSPLTDGRRSATL